MRDVDGDGWSDVEVTAHVRKGTRTPALARACAAWNAQAPTTARRPPYSAIGPKRALKLEFRLDGNAVSATPDTRRTLDDVFAGYEVEASVTPPHR